MRRRRRWRRSGGGRRYRASACRTACRTCLPGSRRRRRLVTLPCSCTTRPTARSGQLIIVFPGLWIEAVLGLYSPDGCRRRRRVAVLPCCYEMGHVGQLFGGRLYSSQSPLSSLFRQQEKRQSDGDGDERASVRDSQPVRPPQVRRRLLANPQSDSSCALPRHARDVVAHWGYDGWWQEDLTHAPLSQLARDEVRFPQTLYHVWEISWPDLLAERCICGDLRPTLNYACASNTCTQPEFRPASGRLHHFIQSL